jgi:hypothetical protein
MTDERRKRKELEFNEPRRTLKMRTLQTKTSATSKQRGLPFRTGCFILLAISPFLFYYGYCWGLWGRNSLLLQYLFQCKCPTASEEWRYPKHVDIIVSACHNGSVILSPSGRLLYVRENNTERTSTDLLDLQTKDKIPIALPEGSIYFLNDDLIYIFVWYGGTHEGGEHIFDRTTNTMYQIQNFIFLEPNAYSYGELDSNLLFKALLQVEKVFLIDDPSETVIALSSDFRTDPNHSFIFEASMLSDDYNRLLEQFLRENNIAYYYIPANFHNEVLSQDGRFMARGDGVYLINPYQKILDGYSLSARGWIYGGHGVLYSSSGRCLVHTFLPFADDIGCLIEVEQPVLLLKVPKEYLSSTQTP